MNKNSFAMSAPKGWNSYDYYDTSVTEAEVKANAQYLADHLKPAGYEYVVIDIEWYSRDAGTKRPEIQYIPFGDDAMDEYGRLQPAENLNQGIVICLSCRNVPNTVHIRIPRADRIRIRDLIRCHIRSEHRKMPEGCRSWNSAHDMNTEL